MSEMKHTPGPWTVGCGGGITGGTTPSVSGPTVDESIEHNYWSADMAEWMNGDRKNAPPKEPIVLHEVITVGSSTLAIVTHHGGRDMRNANARLIAAAPDLLAALNALRTANGADDFDGWHPDFAEAIELARAAIAKATQP